MSNSIGALYRAIPDMGKYSLDEGLVSELRRVVCETHLYRYDAKVKSEYSMICAVADRIQDADRWLNAHFDFPGDCVTAQTFLMLLSVVKSGVESLCLRLGVNRRFADKNNSESYRFFGGVCIGCGLLNGNNIALTDDEFFQYFRALSFSHPQGTFKSGKKNYPFLSEGEIEYSPYIVLEKCPWPDYAKEKPSIGVHVYSNIRDDTKYIFVPYESLLGYLKSRHDSIRDVIAVLAKWVEKAEEKFRSERLDRKVPAEEALRGFVDVLERRGHESYDLIDAIHYLDCPLSNEINRDAVEGFRNEILRIVPELREDLENLNYEDFERRLGHVVDCAWDMIDSPIRYQVNKVFEYFNGRNSEKREWGRMDLEILMDDFVGKWVKVSYDMPDLEIRLLVTIAFYMEYGRHRKLVLEKEEEEMRKNLPPLPQLHIGVDKNGRPIFEWVAVEREEKHDKTDN